MNDKISELIINLKNATMVKKEHIVLSHSKYKENILKLLKEKGYIEDYKTVKTPKGLLFLKIFLAYDEKGKPKISDVKRVSKLSRRLYLGYRNILPVKYGHGMLVLSTPEGIISDKEAKKKKVGGEPLFKIW